MPTVERSRGYDTGHMGIRAGAGYSGATAELDSEVAAAAQALGEAYGLDVQIRFNSDRKSGGAWLRVPPVAEGKHPDTEIGINVSLVVVASLRKYHEDFPDLRDTFEDRLRSDGHDPANPPETYLKRFVYVAREGLSDPTQAGEGGYLYAGIDDVEAGVEMLAVVAARPQVERAPSP